MSNKGEKHDNLEQEVHLFMKTEAHIHMKVSAGKLHLRIAEMRMSLKMLNCLMNFTSTRKIPLVYLWRNIVMLSWHSFLQCMICS